ncbi:MAG: branched-chain amino acid ABC transporter permease [Geminicoccaceae bacterium]
MMPRNPSGSGEVVGRERFAVNAHQILWWLGLVLLVLYVAALCAAPWYVNRGTLSLLYLVLYFILLAASWNIVSGFTGYINFAHVAFVGMGMYGTAIAIVDYQLPWFLAVALGGLIAATYAAVLSFPLLRVKGPYFAITTLAISEGTRVLISTEYMEPLTRAGSGIPLFVRISMETKYFAMLALVVVTVLVTYAIANSRIGLRLLAIREDEHAAENLGIDSTRLKIGVFVLSALLAGLGGGLHATFLSYIDPFNAFNIQYTVIPIVMAFFGGIGTVLGPVIGGTVLELLNDYVWTHVLRLNLAVFGLVLVALILFLPQGILEWLKEHGYLPKTRKI